PVRGEGLDRAGRHQDGRGVPIEGQPAARARVKRAPAGPPRDLTGVRYAGNVFLGAAIVWYVVRHLLVRSPVWALASLIAGSQPRLEEAETMFRSRILNVLLGCAVGLLFLLFGGSNEWKLPLALAVTVLLSSYVVRIPTMWRQAPITTAIVLTASLTEHSRL